MKKTHSLLIAVCFALSLAACGSKAVDGTYSTKMGDFTFTTNGMVSAVLLGQRVETSYRVDGEHVTFRFPGGENITLTKMSDGNLDGGNFGKFTKK